MKSQADKCPYCGDCNYMAHVCVNKRLGPPIDTDALGWRRIYSVPKRKINEDPFLFLGFVPHSCGGYMSVFYWNALHECFSNNMDGSEDKPTHWMPLPRNPVDT